MLLTTSSFPGFSKLDHCSQNSNDGGEHGVEWGCAEGQEVGGGGQIGRKQVKIKQRCSFSMTTKQSKQIKTGNEEEWMN